MNAWLRDHVSGPLPVRSQDVVDAVRFVQKVGLPVVAQVLGLDDRTRQHMRGLVAHEGKYQERWFGVPAALRTVPTVSSISHACGIPRATFYTAVPRLALDLERATVGLALPPSRILESVLSRECSRRCGNRLVKKTTWSGFSPAAIASWRAICRENALGYA